MLLGFIKIGEVMVKAYVLDGKCSRITHGLWEFDLASQTKFMDLSYWNSFHYCGYRDIYHCVPTNWYLSYLWNLFT